MKIIKLFIFLFLFQSSLNAQILDFRVNQTASSADQLIKHLREFDQLGVKEPGTISLNNTKEWLLNYYASCGYNPVIDTFKYNATDLYNIISYKPGLTEKYIIVCGHYDSRTGPGTNDNGSGVSVIMEMARLLKDIPTLYGIRFIHFSGEESGLLGSLHYANQVVGNNDSNLFFVFNLDQLGGTKGANDNFKIKCEYDQDPIPGNNNLKSREITDSLSLFISTYTKLETVLDRAYSSDYMPFEDLGYTITGLYQYSNYPPYHTANDVLAEMDTISLKEIAKGSIAALLHFAKATYITGLEPAFNTQKLKLFPNPAYNSIIVNTIGLVPPMHIRIFDINGVLQLNSQEYRSDFKIDVPETPGLYYLEIIDKQSIRASKNFIVN